jgi:hypothetical protein
VQLHRDGYADPDKGVAVDNADGTVTLYAPYYMGAGANGLTTAITQTTATCTVSGAFASGVTAVNGLNFDFPASGGTISIPSGVNWKGLGLVAGNIGWCRIVAGGSSVSGVGTTEGRFDASVATSGADITTGSLAVEVGAEQVITKFDITQQSSST